MSTFQSALLPLYSPSSSRQGSPSPRHPSGSGSATPAGGGPDDLRTAVNTPRRPSPQSLQTHEGKGEGEARERPGDDGRVAAAEKAPGDKVVRTTSGVRERRVRMDLGKGEEEVVLIDWLPGDPGNPFNWPSRKKYRILAPALFLTSLTALNATSTAIITNWGPEWFDCSREQFELSFTVGMIGIAFTPLVLAPLSEVCGRNPIFIVSCWISAILFIPQAASRNYSGLLAARFFQGMSSSVGNSMVGGTIADMFESKDRGLPMNIFALVIFLGQSLGGFVTGWVGMYGGVAWCYGYQGILCAVSCVLNHMFLRETRGDVLLSRRAKHLTQETGIKHATQSDLERQSLFTLMTVSLVRPLQYLLTEPIVSAISAWIAVGWACIFLGGTSYQLVFKDYGWNDAEAAQIQIVVFIGGLFGFVSVFHQDHLYTKAVAKNGGRPTPEARLHWAAFGGLMFPISLFIFAWTGRPGIPWPIPAIFLVTANWGIYLMYLSVYSYLADAYEQYSSSAQAAQSFARNIVSGIFPLFAYQMYTAMGYPRATTVVASAATVLSAAPILLFYFGGTLRARSKVAQSYAQDR